MPEGVVKDARPNTAPNPDDAPSRFQSTAFNIPDQRPDRCLDRNHEPGQWGYRLTIIWALIGIVVANVVLLLNLAIALTLGVMVLVVATILLHIMRFESMTHALRGSSIRKLL